MMKTTLSFFRGNLGESQWRGNARDNASNQTDDWVDRSLREFDPEIKG